MYAFFCCTDKGQVREKRRAGLFEGGCFERYATFLSSLRWGRANRKYSLYASCSEYKIRRRYAGRSHEITFGVQPTFSSLFSSSLRLLWGSERWWGRFGGRDVQGFWDPCFIGYRPHVRGNKVLSATIYSLK